MTDDHVIEPLPQLGRQKDFKYSGNTYVPMRMKDSNAKATPTPIKSAKRCTHIHTICTRCYESWEDDWEVFYDRTVGGRRLLDAIKKQLPYPAVKSPATAFAFAVYLTDELGRDAIVAPFPNTDAAHDWARAHTERPAPMPTLNYRVTTIVTPEAYDS